LRASDRLDAALVFGGDGSVHRQLAPAVQSQIPLLCVPTGSGNDFARALGLRSREDALAAWHKFRTGAGNVRSVDVARIAKRAEDQQTTDNWLYCCVAGVGLDSDVNRRANAMPNWLRAHGGYILGLPPALRSFQPQTITVQMFDAAGNSERISEPAMMAAFCNAPSYGHGMRIAPRASLQDGLLDVAFVRRTSKLRLLRLFPTVFFGEHLDLPEVEYRQVAGLRVESETPLDIYADGEFICQSPADISVQPRALRVIVP
jgi:diacylglycerol kinase (ATP)